MSNPLGYDYPAGAERDLRAPWNQPGECERCGGDGYVPCRYCEGDGPYDLCDDVTERCRECDGTGCGKTPAQKRADWEDEKADTEREERG